MSLIESSNKFLKDLNQNNIAMILIVIVLSFYASFVVNSIGNLTIHLFSNSFFKFIIFCLIAYISFNNFTLGIILAICVLVTLQVILNINISSNSENFSPYDNLSENYLRNPLELENSLDPSLVNLNLNLENPTVIYNNMIKKGKILLDDSLELEKDMEKGTDIREKHIYDITKRDGNVLVQSGLNRLQICNDGEYNLDGDNYKNGPIKFVKFDKLIGNYMNDPLVYSSFNQLQNNFDKLQNSVPNKDNFNFQLEIVYKNEIDLLYQIYKIKKNLLSNEKINKIDNIIKKINNHHINGKHRNKNITNNNKLLFLHINELVELLS
jgi:hypothetical protein